MLQRHVIIQRLHQHASPPCSVCAFDAAPVYAAPEERHDEARLVVSQRCFFHCRCSAPFQRLHSHIRRFEVIADCQRLMIILSRSADMRCRRLLTELHAAHISPRWSEAPPMLHSLFRRHYAQISPRLLAAPRFCYRLPRHTDLLPRR